MDEVVDAALAHELLVQPRVERDCHTVGGRDRPALLAAALDEHFLGTQVVTRGAEAAATQLLELACLERRPYRDQLGAKLWPEQAEVGLHSELARLDRTEDDLLHAELLEDLIQMSLRERSPFHNQST